MKGRREVNSTRSDFPHTNTAIKQNILNISLICLNIIDNFSSILISINELHEGAGNREVA
jgi:hypothetical protein